LQHALGVIQDPGYSSVCSPLPGLKRTAFPGAIVDRAMEHLRTGKRFTTMTIEGAAVTRDAALDWERNRIETYQDNHDGKRPRYNKV
jgi:hypothetical protein